MSAKAKPFVYAVTCNEVIGQYNEVFEFQFARGRKRECLHSVDGTYPGIAKHICKMLEALGHEVVRRRIGLDGKEIK